MAVGFSYNIFDVIIEPLVHIFNLSLNNGFVPNGLKICKVIHIFQKGDREAVYNYRPISLLTSLSKLHEKVVYLRLLDFFFIFMILFLILNLASEKNIALSCNP